MLKNVLADYLNSVSEREFDYPFMTLLGELCYFDIHYTHNNVEFGKDFIAKLETEGITVQYSFQLKAGDISQGEWRNKIRGQVLEGHLSRLVHPSFDAEIPHQFVLVTTGRLTGNASLGVTDINKTIAEKNLGLPIKIWDHDTLLGDLTQKGLTGIHSHTSAGLTNAGRFYTLVGNSLDGIACRTEIEKYSRLWLVTDLEQSKKILWAAVESELIASICRSQDEYILAIHAKLSFLRLLMKEIWEERDDNRRNHMIELFEIAKSDVGEKTYKIAQKFEKDWEANDFHLQRMIVGQAVMVSYLIHCSRIMEVLSFAYLLTDDQKRKSRLITLLCSLIEKEEGCGHPLSDNYAISLVFPVLALLSAKREKTASSLLRRAAIWTCDRYEEGEGIAPFGAPPEEEIQALLGYPFDFIEIIGSGGSFVATALSDLAILVRDNELYEDVVNDIRASGITPIYWQTQDTSGQFEIDSRDVISYPNVQFDEKYSNFDKHNYATHIRHETCEFRLTKLLGPDAFLILMMVLRDRYFPSVWIDIIEPRSNNPS